MPQAQFYPVRRSDNPNDPFIYLYVGKEWYCYNPNEEPLGGGAMGDVYVGYRCKSKTHERVAVKRVKNRFASNPIMREKARQEASLIYRHPNLVEMIGFCEYAYNSGPCFLVSKFVDGVNIDEFCAQYPDAGVRREKVCNAMIQVLDALDYLHSRGVIHRDIKPSNIMIEQNANARLMDLGIARMNGGNKWSMYGFIGTPQYAAPEQILRGQDNDNNNEQLPQGRDNNTYKIDATTDIYSLGITFYELLTGTNPMDCPSDADTLSRQIKEPLPYNDLIPAHLMRVILRATEKEQSRRYANALQFKQDIISAMAYQPSAWDKITGFLLSHRWTVCIVVSLVLLLVIGCIILLIK